MSLPVLDCRGCGVCCLHMGYPAFNLSVEQLEQPGEPMSLNSAAKADWARWQQMPEALRRPILGLMEVYQPPVDGGLDGPCTWLDPETKLCRHHEHRPQVCRDFEIGSQGCLDWRAAKGGDV